MSEVVRLNQYKSLLRGRCAVSAESFMAMLEVSHTTHKLTPERARWVAGETWHLKNQHSFTEADGSYVLEIPYSDERELAGNIMRFGSDVQVLAPPTLRSKVQRGFLEAVARYV